ncbi:MAG: glycosyl hydrolase, partial [Terracidiphilus sp.]
MTSIVLSAGPAWIFGKQPVSAAEETGFSENTFLVPPDSAKVWVYWWWLDGASSKEGITRDLEEMKKQGISGVLVFDAGTGGLESPKGPEFMSDEWRGHFRHAVEEAGRLGIEMGINVCSGWNAGGPWVEREDAIKAFVWSETHVEGPALFRGNLKQPDYPDLEEFYGATGELQGWYRDISVVACPVGDDGIWDEKKAVNLSGSTLEGTLEWSVPDGKWTILRLGYRMTQARTKYSSSEYTSSERLGWEIDPLSALAMDRHFAHTAAKMIEDAGPLAGRTLKYTHIDSWEIGQPTWTAAFVKEFQSRREYDPTPYLPALAKRIVNSQELTKRFLWDYRRTLADLVAENYYGRLSKLSHEHGLGTHSEAGGPFFTHDIDGLECDGADDIPMGEFWATRLALLGHPSPDPNPTKEEGTSAPFFQSSVWRPVSDDGYAGCARQAATAAHIYGKQLSQAESYTNFNDDWTEYPYYLKPIGDRAFCLGVTRQVINFSALQSEMDAKPGYQWAHVGTHFDRNVTWWEKSHAWLTYLARCQYMLRQGSFAADILYFCGETIPNFALIDRKPLPGYNFDTVNAQVLLTRASAQDGRIALRDGMKYRYLVIPEGVGTEMTVPVLQKISELVKGGITLVGLPPKSSPGLTNYPASDEQLKQLADALWGTDMGSSGMRTVGKGRLIWGKGLDEVVKDDGLQPDVELRALPGDAQLDWIHRHSADGDIYFIA